MGKPEFQKKLSSAKIVLPEGFFSRPVFLFLVVFLLFYSAFTNTQVWAASGYNDGHDIDNLATNWTSKGTRSWSWSSGFVKPQNGTGTTGFLINNYNCANNGTFIFILKGCGNSNSSNGGGVFRFTDVSNYYFISIYEGWTGGPQNSNRIKLIKNSTNFTSPDSILIKNNIDFKNFNSSYKIKVKVSGPKFTFWLYNPTTAKWDSLYQVTDSTHLTGKVGYAYNSTYDGSYASFDSSAWEDGPVTIITEPPDSIILAAGKDTSFKVVCDGARPITYEWQKYPFTGAVDDSSVITFLKAKVSDSGSYRCIVENDSGVDTSRIVKLIVVDTPSMISQKPLDAYVQVDSMAKFSVDSAVKGLYLKYKWFTKVKGSDSWSDVNSSGPSYNIKATQDNDGSSFRCIISNIGGACTSKVATLYLLGSKPAFSIKPPKDTTVLEGTPLKVTVAAGWNSKLTYTWYKSGPAELVVQDSILSIDTVKLINNNTSYYCVVSTGTVSTVSDTMKIHVKGADSVSILTQPQSVVTKASKLVQFQVTALGADPKTYTWHKKGTEAPVGSGETLSLINVSKDNAGTYYCEIRNIKNAVKSDEVNLQVFDENEIYNPLQLTAEYTPKSNFVVLHISNLSSIIDIDNLSYLSIQYGDTTDLIPADTIKYYKPQNKLDKTYQNDSFNKIKTTVTFYASLKDKRGNSSDSVSTTVQVGIARIDNHSKLNVDKVLSTQVMLSWSVPPADSIDSVRIWYAQNVPVPLTYDINKDTFNFKTFGSTITNVTVSSLNDTSKYYFGLQVLKDGLWTYVTDSSSRAITTLKIISSDSVPNQLKFVTQPTFDTTTHKIKLALFVDTSNGLGNLSLDVGITWGYNGFPEINPSNASDKKITFPLTKLNQNFIYEIDPGSNIIFDTTYYFEGWLRAQNQSWSKSNENAKGSVRIPSSTWQAVSYFKGTDSVVYAFNNKVVLSKGPKWGTAGTVNDTLRIFKPVITASEKLIPVSIGMKFQKNNNSPELYVGMKYDSIPQGYSAADIHMYQYNSTTGNWVVLDFTTLDTISRTVTALLKTSLHPYPYMLMVDTCKPVVAILSDTAGAVDPSKDIACKIKVTDNIANVKLTFLCGKGADVLHLEDTLRTNEKESDTTLTIPLKYVTIDNSVRALLIVSDGHFTDTIDFSRSVLRNSSNTTDIFTTAANKWRPVTTTAQLDSSDITSALNGLSPVNGKWTYDPVHFRIFRYVKLDGYDNAKNAKKNKIKDSMWVEYKDSIAASFQIVPGRVIWIKTRTDTTLTLGGGKTVSLKQPYEILLKAKQWTDFSIPYRFNIKIGDIINATPLEKGEADSLVFDNWIYDSDTGKYHAEVLFASTIQDNIRNNPENELVYNPEQPFTICNMLDHDVTLKIPSIPSSMSKIKFLSKKAISGGWGVEVRAKTSEEIISPVYCGYYPGEGVTVIPQSPSFGSVSIKVFDPSGKNTYGNIIVHGKQQNGFAYQLLFENSSEKIQKIQFSINRGNQLQENMFVSIFNPVDGSLQKNISNGSLEVSGSGSDFRWLILGDEKFVEQWKKNFKTYELSLLGPYPNPCRGVLNIRFSLPYLDVKTISLFIFDQLGRKIWDSHSSAGIRPGMNYVRWNPSGSKFGRLAAGAYIIKLTAFNSRNKPVGTRQTKFTYIP